MVGALAGFAMASQDEPSEIYKAGLNTSRLLFAVGDVVVGWLLLRQAEVALSAQPTSQDDEDFYTGKVAAAQWFARQVLPGLAADRSVVEATSNDIMQLPESAF
jgi:hypothetical protein